MPTDPTLYATNQSYLLVVKEATRGTAPTTGFTAVPIKDPQVTPTQTYLADEGYRGSPVVDYDEVLGTRYDMYDFKGDAHLDTLPLILEGIMGFDTLTGTVAPYTHTQTLLNSITTGSQPPSYTFQDTNGFICQQITGAQAVNLTLDFTIAGSLEYTSKYYGLVNTTVATPTVGAYSTTDRLVPAWSNAVNVNSASIGNLIDGSITIERSSEAVMTQGQQGPYSIFTGPMKVTGKLTFGVITSDPNYAFGYSAAVPVTFTFTDPASTHTCLAQMSKTQFMNTKYDRSKNFVQVTADFEAWSNATDALTGYAPIRFVTTNAVSSAF